MIIEEINIAEIQGLVKVNGKLQREDREKYPLNLQLRTALKAMVDSEKLPLAESIEFLILHSYHSNACACMGRREKMPYCNCTMQWLLEMYKYDMVLSILFDRSLG